MKKNKTKILVTGSKGLIGGEFYSILKSKHFNVKGVDTNFNILGKNFFNLLNKFKPKIIIHCASHPGGLSFKDPVKNIQTNYLASVKIIIWCEKNDCKFVFLSSSAVYGNRTSKISLKESHYLKPETIYGINKLALETFIQKYSGYKKFNWIIFRLFATYGPGHKENDYQGIINVIISQIKNKKNIIIKGSLNRTRSLIYVKDAVKIMIDILLKKKNKKIINISSNYRYSVRSIIYFVKKIYNKKFKIKVINGTTGDPMYNIANTSLMKKFTKIKVEYDITKGISEIKKLRD